MQEKNVVSWTSMLHGLMSFGMVEEAKKLFEAMPERNVVTWNSMVAGLAKNGDLEEARCVFDMIPAKDVVSWNNLLSGYIEHSRVEEARALFDLMKDKNVVTWTILISGYCRIGNLDEAYTLFQQMPERNVISWTSMISGFAWNSFYEESLLLFLEMRKCSGIKPNKETFVSLAYACAGMGFPCLSMQLHAQLIVNGCDRRLTDSLIYMYSKLLMMDQAHYIFSRNMKEQTLKSFNFMINGYVQKGELEKARYILDVAPIRDEVSWTSMINGYLNFGETAKACKLFDEMPDKDDIAWTAMISGHIQNELLEEAFILFSQMRMQGVSPIQATYSCLLGAAGATSDLDQGNQLHCLLLKAQPSMDLILENALVAMYTKCGKVDDAGGIFLEMGVRDLVSWNSMIMGYSHHGKADEALELFGVMVRSGEKPNSVTFLGVLSACSHAGLVNTGLALFRDMSDTYCVNPEVQHYVCMINLFGRAGKVEEAEQFVLRLPATEQGVAVWGALLGVCGLNDMNDDVNAKIAKHAARELLQLDPNNAPAHVVLCNMHAASGRYEGEGVFRKEMRLKGMRKVAGCSWV